ncbi:hypothetical protein AAG570_013163 [Ranatra chinensis]|uniref:Uncharacterized protein n=1 Tax=Ranatra chinensis TaxID=642074 RepID=A0ABD0YG49_9HEMI
MFERFKQYYLSHIFPQFSFDTDLYKPHISRSSIEGRKDSEKFLNCRVAVIKWVANFTHLTKAHPISQIGRSVSYSVTPSESEGERSPGSELRRVSVGQANSYPYDTTYTPLFQSSHDVHPSEDPNMTAFNVVRDVLYYCRENVNFIHEIYRQAFLLNFTHSQAIRRAISVYKDWIQINVIELPPFMLDPMDPHRASGPSSNEFPSSEVFMDYIYSKAYYLIIIILGLIVSYFNPLIEKILLIIKNMKASK